MWVDEFIFALTLPLLCDKGLHYSAERKHTNEVKWTEKNPI